MKTFTEKKATLERLGWSVDVATEYRGKAGKDRKSYDLELFSSMELPLTAQDWCRLCMRSSSAPWCLKVDEKSEDGRDLYWSSENIEWDESGPLRGIQSVFRGWFYEGGCVSVKEFVEVGDLLREYGSEHWKWEEHNPFQDLTAEQLAEYIEFGVKGDLSPWGKLAVLYHLVKDHHVPDMPEAQHERQSEIKGALMLLHQMAVSLGLESLFANWSTASKTTEEANRLLRLYRFVPAFKIVHERIGELAPEPLEGWAIIDLEAGEGEVAENHHGYCVYTTKSEAEHMLELGRRAQELYEDEVCTPRRLRKPVDDQFKIRAVRISLEKGLEFLDEGAEPKPRIEWRAKPHWYEEETENIEMLFDQYCQTRWPLNAENREKERENRVAYDEARLAWCEAARFFNGY